MAQRHIMWMVADSIEATRKEVGPFRDRLEAEVAAARLRMRYVLRYEQTPGPDGELVTQRVLAIQVLGTGAPSAFTAIYTRCAACGLAARHNEFWQAEVWSDIHEFEHSRHLVRLFVRTKGDQLKEVPEWRRLSACVEKTD